MLQPMGLQQRHNLATGTITRTEDGASRLVQESCMQGPASHGRTMADGLEAEMVGLTGRWNLK